MISTWARREVWTAESIENHEPGEKYLASGTSISYPLDLEMDLVQVMLDFCKRGRHATFELLHALAPCLEGVKGKVKKKEKWCPQKISETRR